MVCITVQQASADGEPPAWCIIELQGAIERLAEPEKGAALELGTLCVPANNPEIVQLTLGSHQLEGKVVPLKKPLALLDFGSRDGAADGTRRHCEIVGVIRQKYIFKTRPKPLITKPGK